MAERGEGPFEAYLREVAAGLGELPPAARKEIVRELRAHLEDAVAACGGVADTVRQAEIVGRFGSAQRLGRALALARRGMVEGEAMRRVVGGLARWAVAGVAILVAALFGALLVWGVPAATPDNLTEIAGAYGRTVLPASAEHDLLIEVHDHATIFRVNDDRVPEIAVAELLREVQPGDRIYLTVYKRFLPADPQGRGIVPVAAIRTDTATYLALPAGGGGAAPPYSRAIIVVATLLARVCVWPEVRATLGGRRRRMVTAG